jgi:hypothetical protein
MELIIVIGGVIILLIGSFLFVRHTDERIIFKKHKYYRNAGYVFLALVMFACMISLPFVFRNEDEVLLPNAYIAMLVGLGCVYFSFNFKLKGISFNYSFIEEDHYYKRVFANIGKITGVLFAIFACVSIICCLLSWPSSGHFLIIPKEVVAVITILCFFPLTALVVALGYLYVSWIEYRVYHDENRKITRGGTLIGLSITLVLQILILTILLGGSRLLPPSISSKMFERSDMLALLIVVLTSLGIHNFMTTIKKSKKAVLAVRLFTTLQISIFLVIWLVNFFQYNCLVKYLWDDINNFNMHYTTFLNVKSVLLCIPILVDLIFSWLLIVNLVKEMKMSKGFLIFPILQTLLLPLSLYLAIYWRMYIVSFVSLQSILNVFSLLILTILLNRHSYGETMPPETEAINQIE